jgi:hypothetical protein
MLQYVYAGSYTATLTNGNSNTQIIPSQNQIKYNCVRLEGLTCLALIDSASVVPNAFIFLQIPELNPLCLDMMNGFNTPIVGGVAPLGVPYTNIAINNSLTPFKMVKNPNVFDTLRGQLTFNLIGSDGTQLSPPVGNPVTVTVSFWQVTIPTSTT